MKGIIGDEEGTLLKYEEVAKKLDIPKGYVMDGFSKKHTAYKLSLKKEKPIQLNELTIWPKEEEDSFILITEKDIKEKLGIDYDIEDIYFYVNDVNEKDNLIRNWKTNAEIQYLLHNDKDKVRIWFEKKRFIGKNRFVAIGE